MTRWHVEQMSNSRVGRAGIISSSSYDYSIAAGGDPRAKKVGEVRRRVVESL